RGGPLHLQEKVYLTPGETPPFGLPLAKENLSTPKDTCTKLEQRRVAARGVSGCWTQTKRRLVEEQAAVVIQAHYRGYRVRCEIHNQYLAATTIQAHYRGYRTRQALAESHRAATTIQAHWRGYLEQPGPSPLHSASSQPRRSGSYHWGGWGKDTPCTHRWREVKRRGPSLLRFPCPSHVTWVGERMPRALPGSGKRSTAIISLFFSTPAHRPARGKLPRAINPAG
uniref:Uncharacterized protein n=1 Tax=Gopherus agassizii TaxID=38772 RepID=A0A452IR68_9SAUR